MSLKGNRSRVPERIFVGLCLAAIYLPLALLILLFGGVVLDAMTVLDWRFLTSFPSRNAENAGILPALAGSLGLILLATAMAMPVGVGAAIYLEEYERRGRLADLIEVNISNLAGVPSVIYGLLGLGLFVRTFGFGRSLFAGAATLALLMLPIVIMASREALRTVPLSIREGCLALGATRWQAIRQVVLPTALPGILTGSILSISRAIGETAPLIVVGALTFITFLPDSPSSPFTALPIQIFNWVSRPQKEFLLNAAAGIVVLMGTMLLLNATAIWLRNKYQKKLYF
jgi:phosphate transport system permease protein